jgi:hypothetical protein
MAKIAAAMARGVFYTDERINYKDRGVSRTNFSPSLTEYEFRYNHRHESLPDTLFEVLRLKGLVLSTHYAGG